MLHFIHKFNCRFYNHSECVRKRVGFSVCAASPLWSASSRQRSAVNVEQSDTCSRTIWCRKQHNWNVFLRLNQQKRCHLTWQMKRNKTVRFNHTLTQFCFSACSAVVDPHWGDLLFMATGFNKALQSPWFALAELIDAVRGMVKQFTEIRWQPNKKKPHPELSGFKLKGAAQLWLESHTGQWKTRTKSKPIILQEIPEIITSGWLCINVKHEVRSWTVSNIFFRCFFTVDRFGVREIVRTSSVWILSFRSQVGTTNPKLSSTLKEIVSHFGKLLPWITWEDRYHSVWEM